ncbi:hypothetical protein MGYG_07140 [Nannizzia gypsea CBS 118893]|uniref:Uncharacterized protein n=1 Tax=Arthroderma gypseum (strain ATCC MYA-4604 / CBS 118893) TaxID=535722 RepID=E4V268_ARTGP|nr:hypothetical protein MGYG_07140 [Nannizzia gypsea CBS 118893]EFR04133.1 hypothetical protein MGYG_07140 [Nannizzia gypsea CBS 118893]
MDGEHGVQNGKNTDTDRPADHGQLACWTAWLASRDPRQLCVEKKGRSVREDEPWVFCRVVDIDLLSSVENKILSTLSAMGGGSSTKREGGKETEFSAGESGRINSSGSEVDSIESQVPPLSPRRPPSLRRRREERDEPLSRSFCYLRRTASHRDPRCY